MLSNYSPIALNFLAHVCNEPVDYPLLMLSRNNVLICLAQNDYYICAMKTVFLTNFSVLIFGNFKRPSSLLVWVVVIEVPLLSYLIHSLKKQSKLEQLELR
jgi:hypothetical protein